jgi:hypothetical protein
MTEAAQLTNEELVDELAVRLQLYSQIRDPSGQTEPLLRARVLMWNLETLLGVEHVWGFPGTPSVITE